LNRKDELNLAGADLRGADLRGADLRGADLRGARIERVNLEDANLSGLVLVEGAEPKGTDLREVTDLSKEQIERATGDPTTKLPYGLQPPSWWGKSTNGRSLDH
jgi:hypothetical protein